MLKANTHVFQFDPVCTNHETYLVPLFHRIEDFAIHKAKLNTHQEFTRMMKARIVSGDPNLLVLVVVHMGQLVGHSLFTAEIVDGVQVLYVHQVDVDQGYPRAIDLFVRLSNNWAMQKGLVKLVMEVPFDFHPVEIWSKSYARYGFKPVSYTVERLVG